MNHVIHLNKSGAGMNSKTACGRNVVRTPISTNWEEFKETANEHRCEKCDASKQAEVNRKADKTKEAEELAKWEPSEDSNEWKKNDDMFIKNHKFLSFAKQI